MSNIKELEDYRKFTAPAELHKAINTLKGIVAGITTDIETNDKELDELVNWCTLHKHLEHKHPFTELVPMVEAALSDGMLTQDEKKDILWLCGNFVSDAGYYDLVTSSIQFLSGLMHGIMADGVLSDSEIISLRKWLSTSDFLRGCYPYDELESLMVTVLQDGAIDNEERDMLMAFFSNFIDMKTSLNLSEPDLEQLRDKYSVAGICALCPDIEFEDNLFCFTGQSYRAKREEIAAIICDKGGLFNNNVTKKTKYLVVGNAGNSCWAYACYGRKIEEAVNMRKAGHRITIVNETDFWDVVDDG